MKKLLMLLPFILIGYMQLSGQTNENDSKKWTQDPRMSRIIPNGDYAPLPQTENIQSKNKNESSRIVTTTIGDFLVGPNILVHPSFGTQSETPITRHPTNPLIMFGSANTFRGGTSFSTGVYVTTDGGISWSGSDTLNSGSFNYGDPGPVIDKDGRFLISYITVTGATGASYSTNSGITWSPTFTFPGSTPSSDKNLSGTDDIPSSPYYGRSYTVYTEFGGSYINRIVISFTTDGGVSWSAVAPVSPVPSPGHYHQGADIKIGPGGEVYVVWANALTTGNLTEDSLGFAKSTNGGVSWVVSRSNADNMNGIRSNNLFNNIRSNSFPRIDIDKSGGQRNGWIYASTGEKFIAPARDSADAIIHRSTDGGTTWTSIRVNQDPPGNFQYFSAVRVDEQGGVNVIYYDTRNTPTKDSAQIYVSRSIDGGDTWTDILISDHKFKPKPISGTAGGYQGDYIGITSGNNKLWPYWCDDYSGIYQAWTASVNISTTPLNSFSLNSPAVSSRIVTYPNSYIPYTFTWDTSTSAATYKWIFGSPLTTPRKITFSVTVNSLTLLTGQLDSILASLGVAVGDSLTGQWDVWAFRNAVVNDSLKATNGPRAITLKRGVPILSAFNLISPPAGATITTSAYISSNINFNWSTSGAGTTYKWKFGSPTIPNVIRFSFSSNISGIDSSISIVNFSMDNLLSSLGVQPGDSIQGEWSAWAFSGFDSVKASQNYPLTFKRQGQAEVIILYDSTNANCRTSKDSAVASLNNLGISNQLYNRNGVNALNSISFKGFKKVLVLGEGSSVMSAVLKDSIKKYLSYGTPQSKSRLIIMGEDVGYQFDRPSSAFYDSAFCRSMCGFQYVADRPGPIGQRGLIGITINTNIADSSNGPSMDVLKRSASVPLPETSNLYRYRLFNDSMNAIGRISANYNVAVFAFDLESLRPAFDSPNSLTDKRIMYGATSFVDEIATNTGENTTLEIPVSFSLSQNYPNPFNPVTKIKFELPADKFVTLKIYDALGKEVAVLVNEKKESGRYNVEFSGSNLASGIYFYQLNAGDFIETKRMILLK